MLLSVTCTVRLEPNPARSPGMADLTFIPLHLKLQSPAMLTIQKRFYLKLYLDAVIEL
jgi:hypothetical protein